MVSLLQDTVVGGAIRLVAKERLPYEEEKDPSLLDRLQPAEYPSTDGRIDDRNSSQCRISAREPEQEKCSPIVIDWWSKTDPENPRNWSQGKKALVVFNICLLTFSVYIGSAIYSPGVIDVTQKFHISPIAARLGMSLYVAGYGLGPMLWSPLSETPQIGRSPVYLVTLVVFIALQVPTALSSNLGMLLAFRFLTGFFGSPALALGGATIADLYKPSKRAYCMLIWSTSATCGPVLGPVIGGFAAQAEGWKWTIWELMWLSGFSLVITCDVEKGIERISGRYVLMNIVVKPILLNFKEPMVFLLNLYTALIYGLLYIWFESFGIVFPEFYHFNLGQEGLAFIGILVGTLVTIPLYSWWLHKHLEPKFDEHCRLAPEARLPAACVGSFFIPICLFWFGWSSRPDIHWIMPVIGSAFFAVGSLLLFNAVLNYLTDAYPAHVASVLAGNDVMRSGFGTGFPLFATPMYKNLGVGWASSTLGFLSIVFIPIPFVLWKYGKHLRRNHSRYARKDM